MPKAQEERNESAKKNAASSDPVSFEDAMKRLEAAVEAMESDELPLETLLAKFEEGARLAQMCQKKLSEAELKIQQLEKTVSGETDLGPVDLKDAKLDD